MTKNRLSSSTSPYLRQHADNPVHWWPWSDDALEAASAQKKPILLSIGYAACHWCHVMAHESFEDEDTAEIMNTHFINIKVDREERPDLDHIYQTAIQIMGQQGGWPLTIFLLPNQKPFWGGTYFPKTPQYGQPAFKDILDRIHSVYQMKDPAVFQNAEQLTQHIVKQTQEKTVGNSLTLDTINNVGAKLLTHIDSEFGGFGQHQKFPSPMNIELLWRFFIRTQNKDAHRAVLNTLTHICEGGIYDHLGGGFSRYTVDRRWLIPHFEKMLNDNALLIRLLTQVWRVERNPLYAQRVEETINWLIREIKNDAELFTSSFDADSEGEEGKFYTWDYEEINQVLGRKADIFNNIYDVTPAGNWEGRNILNRLNSIDRADDQTEARKILFEERYKRVTPGHDDKCLCDWNSLTIIALTEASCAFNRQDWLDQATKSFKAMEAHFYDDGQLLHIAGSQKGKIPAFLEDYTAFALGAIALYETTGHQDYLEKAIGAEIRIEQQFKAPDGGYYMTAHHAPPLISRPRPISDQATPSGNGLMAHLLTRLFLITEDPIYQSKADALFLSFSGELHRNFFPLGSYLNAFDDYLSAPTFFIKGRNQQLLKALWEYLPPFAVIKYADSQAISDINQDHPAYKNLKNDGDYILICQHRSCSLPLRTVDQIKSALSSE